MRVLHWIGSSKKDYMRFPDIVLDYIGYSLSEVQDGRKPNNAKPLQGFGGAGIQEIVENDDGNTFRAVYTVALKHGVYVLHCFQKRSVKGIKTPQPDIDLIKARLQRAKEIDAEIENEKRKN
jgi:phage-related protein